jgi:hypothetical protein
MKNFFSNAIKAGLLVGTFDIIAASIHSTVLGGSPVQVLKYVASGALGPEARTGGIEVALTGLVIHFFIAMSFTFFFFFLVSQIPSLVKYPVLTGIVYGIFVWSAMRFIVLPYLSRLTPRPIVGREVIINSIVAAVILIVCIGIPLAFRARNAFKKKK